jgi:orotidine-5'-phosphate decarboxylase
LKPEQIMLALDVPDGDSALAWVQRLGNRVGSYKVGLQLFTREGPELVRRLRGEGVDIFLDLKLHDIPNTVAKAVESALALDVQFLTVHASGGPKMCRAAAEVAAGSSLCLLGVTVLTAMDDADLRAVGVHDGAADQVNRLARMASDVGIPGFVCSPLEVKSLRESLPPDRVLVTPGVRPEGAARGDQVRIATPEAALAAGASHVVIGRPILQAQDPEAVLGQLLK